MKKSLTFHVLEKVAEGFCAIAALTDEILRSAIPAGTSYKGVRSSRNRASDVPTFTTIARDEERRVRHQLANVLHRLKKDGLISVKERHGKTGFFLSEDGKRVFAKKSERILPDTVYDKEPDDVVKIIIYDIPEAQSFKRDWVRSVLHNLGLRLLQKSVWIGRVKIPDVFMRDLANLQLLNYVEVFSIGKTGTIRKID